MFTLVLNYDDLPHYGRNNQGTITVFVHPVCFKVVVAPLFIKWTNLTLGKIMTEKKSLPALSLLQQREMQKKKKKPEIGRQAKVNF